MILRSNQPVFLMILSIATVIALTTKLPAQNPQATISIDVNAGRHEINPNIYGVAYASKEAVRDLNTPINRMGGNNTTRYNWKLNADNRGSDWYFESIADDSSDPGERGDSFIAKTKDAGAESAITIPMINWIAKVGPKREKLYGFSVAKYGAQKKTDAAYNPDAGDGNLTSTGKPVIGNDPRDANVTNSSAFQQDWVKHLVSKWGDAAHGGLKYYIMDNEPSIWQGTHRDVHPVGATMEEIRDDILNYAGKVKAADPTALVVAPEEWGWNGYLYSGYDQQWGGAHGWSGSLPDRARHGGKDYLPWLLDQLHKNNIATGKRLLDIFSVHYYPQGGEFGGDVSPAMQLRRNRSTRSLWDPNYIDESWIKTQVQLIPRLKDWVVKYYPGTQTCIDEYNWGADSHISGATAQADILGIFGREGLDMAERWTSPGPATPTYKAIKMYRNYDGNRSAFGNISIADKVADPDTVSSFAALRSADHALTVMVINKYLSEETPVKISLAHFKNAGAAQVWQLTSANAIARLEDAPVNHNDISLRLPAQSITLLVIPADSHSGKGKTNSPKGKKRH